MNALPRRLRFLSSVATAFFLLSFPACAENWIDIEPALAAYDNLTRAQQHDDRRADQALALHVTGARAFVLSGFDTVDVALDARTEAFRRYRGLDVLAFGASVGYRHKFGLGVDVPWIMTSAHGAHDAYRDNTRDGNRLTFTAEVGRRLSERWNGTLGVTLDRRYGKFDPTPEVPGYSARVFDLQGASAHIRLGYAPTERLLVGLQLTARRGDVESTAQQGRAIFLASDAIAHDPAFNDPALYAYRLRATTYGTLATASLALGGQASLNIAYVDNLAHAAYSLAYTDRALMLSLVYRHP